MRRSFWRDRSFFVALGCVALLAFLLYQLLLGDLERRDKVASVAGLVVALISLFVATGKPLLALFRNSGSADPAAGITEDELRIMADRLALVIRQTWADEAGRRGVRDVTPVDLHWRTSPRRVSADPSTILGDAVGGQPVRFRFAGRLDDIVDKFSRLPKRRLVILGSPGAGKTTLALLLTIGLIDRRVSGGAVPVPVSVAAWDPQSASLRDWIAREIGEEYYAGRSLIPVELIRRGAILPVLDGLDEMPNEIRPDAIRQIGRTFGADSQLVVTSRTAEYERAVIDVGTALDAAAVIEIQPVNPADAIRFLSERNRNGAWDAVINRLREDSTGPLATALSTPLMISLLETLRSRGDGHVATLLDLPAVEGHVAIERWLLDALIPAVYEERPSRGGPSASAARRYLEFLANHLQRNETTILSWWQVHQAVHPVVIGAAYTAVGWLCAVVALLAGLPFALAWAPALAFGAVAGLVASTAHVPQPSRTDWSLRTRLPAAARRLVRGVTIGVLLGLGLGLEFGMDGGVSHLLLTHPAVWAWAHNGPWLAVSAAIGVYFGILITVLVTVPASLIAGLARGVGTGIRIARKVGGYAFGAAFLMFGYSAASSHENRTDILGVIAKRTSPATEAEMSFVRPLATFASGGDSRYAATAQEFLAFLPRSLLVAGVLGLAFGICVAFRDAAGTTLNIAEVATPEAGWRSDRRATVVRFVVVTSAFAGTVFAAGAIRTASLPPLRDPILLGVAIGALTATFSAWFRFKIANIVLWLQGLLPLDGMSFFQDARERGILRQAGAAYQFRHALLQDHLSTPTKAATGVRGRNARSASPHTPSP